MLLQSSDDLMSTEMKPNPESLMAFQSFPYTSRKIQDGQCSIIVIILLFCFLIWQKYKHTNTRRGILCPTPPSGLPIWSSAPPWDHNGWFSRTSRSNRWLFQPLGTGEQLDGVLREPLPRNVLPHRPLLRLPGRLGLLRCRSSENSSSTNAAENEGSVQCG